MQGFLQERAEAETYANAERVYWDKNKQTNPNSKAELSATIRQRSGDE